MSKTTFSPQQVQHVAQLANIPVSDNEAQQLAKEFAETLVVVDKLKLVDVGQTQPTHQTTGFTNIWRPDSTSESESFTQAEALANAEVSHDGYFLVPGVLAAKDT